MKIRFSIFFLIISFLLYTSCDDDDNNVSEAPIAGTWHLKNVTGGIAGINIEYNRNLVKWTFKESNSKLTVENNILTTGPEDIYAGLDSGVYDYEIQEIEKVRTLYINDNKRGIVLIINDSLQLDDGIAADGLLTVFER